MNKKIGELIKNKREETNMKSAELAAAVGVSQGTISNIENGKFGKRSSTMVTIKNIFLTLDIPYDDEIRDYFGSVGNSIKNYFINKDKDKDTIPYTLETFNMNLELGSTSVLNIAPSVEINERLFNKMPSDKQNTFHIVHLMEVEAINTGLALFFKNNEEELKKIINESIEKSFEDFYSLKED